MSQASAARAVLARRAKRRRRARASGKGNGSAPRLRRHCVAAKTQKAAKAAKEARAAHLQPLAKMPSLAMAEAALPFLYSFRRCPYAMRARLALQSSGVDYEHREVVLKQKPAHLLALSPKGTVPVLWLPGSARTPVLEQSWDIMRWALGMTPRAGGRHPKPAWPMRWPCWRTTTAPSNSNSTATNTPTGRAWPAGKPTAMGPPNGCTPWTLVCKRHPFWQAHNLAWPMPPWPHLCANLPTPTPLGLPTSPGAAWPNGWRRLKRLSALRPS